MTLKVGDEVRVFDVNGHWYGQPDTGCVGKVTKVGRKYATIHYYHSINKFHLETGVISDGYGHHYFRTLEQAEDDRLAADARSRLHALKIEAGRYGTMMSGRKLARLADFAEALMNEDNDNG